MATEVKFHFDANGLHDAVQDAAEEAVRSGVRFAYKSIAIRIPANRTKTRRYLRMMTEGLFGEVGIQFPSNTRYPSHGTETEQIMNDAWRLIEESVIEVVEQAFYQQLEEYVR